MQDFIFSIEIVAPLFIFIMLGYFLKRIKLFPDDFIKMANKISFSVFLPILLFRNIASSNFYQDFNWKLTVFILIGVLIVFGAAALIVPLIMKDKKRIPVVVQALFRSNFILFGVPICEGIYGAQGAVAASLVAGFIVPLFNILAVVILSAYNQEKKNNAKTYILSIVKNPLIIGSLLGMAMSLLPINLPKILSVPVDQIANLATPFSLIVLGGAIKFKSLFKNIKTLSIVSVIKLIALPTIVVFISYGLGFRGNELVISFIAFGAPVAIASYIMAEIENADFDLAGEFVAVTAFLCVFTMFIFILISKTIGIL